MHATPHTVARSALFPDAPQARTDRRMPPTEDQLVRRAQRGDQAALGDLLQNHRNQLYNVALRMVANRDDAAEITQDALLKVIQHINNYDGRSKLSTWMVRITMNQSISFLRKRRLRKTTSLDLDLSDASAYNSSTSDGTGPRLADALASDQEPSPHQCVEQDEMVAQLHSAMQRLDEDFRSVLVLRDINDMDYRQIADVLAVPVGTVKSRLFRARLALRQEMAKVYPTLLGEQDEPVSLPQRSSDD